LGFCSRFFTWPGERGGFLRSVGRVRPLRVEEARFAWLSLAPALFFFALFVGFPVVYSFILSFEDWNLTSPVSHWVGLANYEALLEDETFLRSLLQTTVFTVAITAVVVVFSLAMALLIDLKLRFDPLRAALPRCARHSRHHPDRVGDGAILGAGRYRAEGGAFEGGAAGGPGVQAGTKGVGPTVQVCGDHSSREYFFR
jgi:hypothetical protein